MPCWVWYILGIATPFVAYGLFLVGMALDMIRRLGR